MILDCSVVLLLVCIVCIVPQMCASFTIHGRRIRCIFACAVVFNGLMFTCRVSFPAVCIHMLFATSCVCARRHGFMCRRVYASHGSHVLQMCCTALTPVQVSRMSIAGVFHWQHVKF